MIPLKAIIVDDEPMACQALSRMLEEFPQVRVCGQADSVRQAEVLIKQVGADAVFLDIELFGESGFDLVPRLHGGVAIVFVTAFNHYAIRAFEVNALDYLLKPVVRERLAVSIDRLQNRVTPKVPAPDPGRLVVDDVILVLDGKRRRILALERVCLIEADKDFTVLHAIDGHGGIVWRPMSKWEAILPREKFVRIHRGRMVNLDHVETFESAPGGRLRLHLTGISQPCHASRRLSPLVRRRLNARTAPNQA